MKMTFLAIIPARYASMRFPGKPLVDIGGKPMIQHVYEHVKEVVETVFVATDDERIFNTVEEFGGKAVMTSDKHKSGTDRCYEAYSKVGAGFDVILNIQGDEPFVQPKQIKSLMECFSDPKTEIATLVKPFDERDSFDDLASPNSPKVVLNNRMEAMYFSRSVIPYKRGVDRQQWLSRQTFYKHIGMYAYKAEILAEITKLEQSPLELAESLEQLRWLENGYSIKTGITHLQTIGIDTPEDLEKARKLLS